MIIVLVMGLCNSLLYNARIGYENTYDMRGKYFQDMRDIFVY